MLLESDSWRPNTNPGAPRVAPGLISLDLLASLCRDFRRIVTAMAATLAIGLAIVALIPPSYVADATLLVLLSSNYAPQTVAGQPETGGMLDRDAILKSEIEILTSPSLQDAAMDQVGAEKLYPGHFSNSWPHRLKASLLGHHNPHAAAARDFSEHLTATADKTGNILALSFTHPDPTLAAAALNAVIAEYLQRRRDLYRDAQATGLAGQADRLRQQLDAADQSLADFKEKSGIVNYDTQRDLLLRQRDDLARDLQHRDSQAAEAQQSQSAAAAQLAGTSQSVVLSDETDQRRAAELARVGATNTGTTVRHGRSSVYEALDLDRKRAAIGLQAARAAQARDVQQLTAVQTLLARLETDEVELGRLTRARDLLAQNYAAVSKAEGDRQLVDAAAASQDSNVRVIQAAAPPDRPTNLRLVAAVASVLLSLFMGVLVAALSRLLRSGYMSPETLEKSLGVPVLASIPDLTRLDRSYDRLSDYEPAEG